MPGHDSATDRREDKPSSLNPLPMADRNIAAPVPPSSNSPGMSSNNV
jgi:hypothetical protein